MSQVAIRNEVLVAISNRNYAGPGNMLATWMECVQRVGVTNAMVVALDADTKRHAESVGLHSVEFHEKVKPCLCHCRCLFPLRCKWGLCSRACGQHIVCGDTSMLLFISTQNTYLLPVH